MEKKGLHRYRVYRRARGLEIQAYAITPQLREGIDRSTKFAANPLVHSRLYPSAKTTPFISRLHHPHSAVVCVDRPGSRRSLQPPVDAPPPAGCGRSPWLRKFRGVRISVSPRSPPPPPRDRLLSPRPSPCYSHSSDTVRFCCSVFFFFFYHYYFITAMKNYLELRRRDAHRSADTLEFFY